MQDYNDNSGNNGNNQNQNIRRMPPRGQAGQPPAGQRPPRQGQPPRRPADGQPQRGQTGGRSGQPQPQRRPVEGRTAEGQPVRFQQGQPQRRPVREQAEDRQPQGGKNDRAGAGRDMKKRKRKNTPAGQDGNKKKKRKILLFVVEILLLLILVGTLWMVKKAQKIQIVEIDDTNVKIDKDVQIAIQQEGNSKKGYRNIALFGVDSREKQLNKSTRTDVIMIASINLDTNEVRLASVYRDTWLNMSTDKYSKANAAYAQGGAKQAISMLNMNLDMDITDFITVGFDAVIDVIDAVGGVEIDVKEAEITDLNSYQISMAGKPIDYPGAVEQAYEATPGVDYIPVKNAGLQKLNGLQATAYCRIRYVGNGDFDRTARQRTVLTAIAKKAMTMNPATLNKIVDAVFGEIATSLDTQEILSLLSGIASYKIGEQTGFPFADSVQTGRVGKASVVIPVDLTYNVKRLHAFLFGNENYNPSDTVKRCSEKIAADTGVSYKGE